MVWRAYRNASASGCGGAGSGPSLRVEIFEEHEIHGRAGTDSHGTVVKTGAAQVHLRTFWQLGQQSKPGMLSLVGGEDLDGGYVPRKDVASLQRNAECIV